MRDLQPHEIDERAANARSILGNSAFRDAVEELMADYITTLKSEQVGSSVAATAHASMRVLGDIEARLNKFVQDAKVAQIPRRR